MGVSQVNGQDITVQDVLRGVQRQQTLYRAHGFRFRQKDALVTVQHHIPAAFAHAHQPVQHIAQGCGGGMDRKRFVRFEDGKAGGLSLMATVTDPRDIILAPVISEKSYGLIEDNVYTFFVHPDSNKTQIKIAIEKIFSVKVESVNTINRQGKRKRTRFGYGKRKDTKRAIVTLAEGSKPIDIFGAPA